MITRLRTFIRSKWNTVMAVAALCALPLAVSVAITGGDVALVGLLLLQAVGMVGLALVGKRALTIYRRVGQVEDRLDVLTSAVRESSACSGGPDPLAQQPWSRAAGRSPSSTTTC